MRIDVLDKGFVELVDSMGSDETIAASARLSYLGQYRSEDSDSLLISQLINKGHTSPLEQVELRFLVKAPIYIARQWMRHRTWSYSEVSRRYTAKNMDFYTPSFEKEGMKELYNGSVSTSLRAYQELIGAGIRKEQARGVLPTCMYTTFYAKTDLNNLFHFLELRLEKGAQYEITEYSNAICKLIEPIIPMTFEIWKDKMNRKDN